MTIPCPCCPTGSLVRCTPAGEPAFRLLCPCDPADDAQVEQPTSFTNGSFELPAIANGGFAQVANASVPGWDSGNPNVEIWNSPFTGAVPGLLPYADGDQLVEVASLGGNCTIFQVVTVPVTAGTIHWGYSHHRRGRPLETMELRLGDNAVPVASHALVDSDPIAAPDNTWHTRSGTWPKPAGLTSVRMTFTGLPNGVNDGNLLDRVTFRMTTPCVVGDREIRWYDRAGNVVDPLTLVECP